MYIRCTLYSVHSLYTDNIVCVYITILLNTVQSSISPIHTSIQYSLFNTNVRSLYNTKAPPIIGGPIYILIIRGVLVIYTWYANLHYTIHTLLRGIYRTQCTPYSVYSVHYIISMYNVRCIVYTQSIGLARAKTLDYYFIPKINQFWILERCVCMFFLPKSIVI